MDYKNDSTTNLVSMGSGSIVANVNMADVLDFLAVMLYFERERSLQATKKKKQTNNKRTREQTTINISTNNNISIRIRINCALYASQIAHMCPASC
jgi:hypothetical protein